ncbi:LysM peptidoglycan-binding domain-containing protein [Aliivibrio fischeri]|uniref:glycosyl hydrolase 108 family protein n=1 Tax=Aliivibrio fischeri TaxID=668 RepID=UPI00107E96E5|nr:glycosyl hydrolase 108 family protein [Aliivibrio fischeri]TGA72227.1 LysM peptidoglycan-binding domain-containing protein [Aliivibrio fischeri]
MKAWDEKLEDFVDLDELESEITKPKKQPTYINAFYKPVEDGFITPEQKAKQEQPHNEPVVEKSAPVAAYEYNIEIACAQEDLVTYQIGAFSLGKTDNEPLISSWKKSASQAGFTLLTASIMVNEPKTLYREFFSLSGQALSFKEVTPVKKGVGTHTESFVPIKTAVQVGEQLGWPTAGFYYHFVDDKLAHEYQIVGNDASTFFVTQSSVDQLSSSLLSDHQYNFILLPWKINNSPVTRQHLLYLPQKITQQEFAELNATWLDENACLLDVETIVKSKNESVLVREKTDNDSVTYVIQSGDSLWKIAHQQGTTIEKLVELNPQYKGKEGQIKVGDTLVIELKKNESTAALAHVVVLNGDGNRETWDEIAKQHCMAPKELLKLNPMFEDNPSALKVGDELCVNDSQQAQDKEERITLPPIVLTHIGQVSSFVNSFSTMSKRLLNAFVVAALSDKNIPANTPIVNVGKKTLRSTELSSSNDLELLANGKGQLIKKKADGESVKAIQKALLKLNFDLGSAGADGKFGSGTESVIKTFQSTYTPTNKIHADYKIGSADGIVGKNTLLALDEAVVGFKPVKELEFIGCDPKEFFINEILKHEGGFVNHPDDPGGATNKGVIFATWKKYSLKLFNIDATIDSLKSMTDDQAYEIFLEGYWKKSLANKIKNCEFAYQFVDFYYNAPQGAAVVLQRTVNSLGENVAEDWNMGNATLSAVNKILDKRKAKELYISYREKRIEYYNHRADTVPGADTFRKGWIKRAESFRAY